MLTSVRQISGRADVGYDVQLLLCGPMGALEWQEGRQPISAWQQPAREGVKGCAARRFPGLQG